MAEKSFDVFGVGNAIVDILAQVPDESLAKLDLAKGAMTLMETDRQSDVLQHLEGQSLRLASGGSAANTMVAIVQSGGTGIYAGKVAHDTHGEFYKTDFEEAGVKFYVPPAGEASLPTGTSVILTTPDAERTMCTHLGISTALCKSDIDADLLSQSKCCYVEGYLWTGEDTRAASIEAFEQSKKHGVRAAFTLSDMFLVDLFGDAFRGVIKEYCDIVFCNADEARKFLGQDDVQACATELGKLCELAFVTDGGNGCYVVEKGAVEHVSGFPVNAVDTVGAGDAFAGGALYGITNGLSTIDAAKWGNYFASQVVQQFGPRIDRDMKQHLAETIG